MKTRSITQGAMSVALYGLLLLLNQQTGFAIESMLSWVFILPLLLYTAKEGGYAGFVTGIAMGLLSFFFGSFTTWFYSWTALFIGFIYGFGVFKKASHSTNFVICFVLSVIMYMCMIYLWAAIFGYDLHADFDSLSKLIPFIDFSSFCAVFIVLMALLQTLCIHMISILACHRLRIDIRPIGSLSLIHGNPLFGIVSLVLWVLFLFGQNMLEYSIYTNGIRMAFFLDFIVLDGLGAVVLMDFGVRYRIRLFSFLAVIGAFIPILNLIWIFLGELDCLFSIRKSWNVRG